MFLVQGRVLAQDEDEEDREVVVANPVIDCSTNPGYQNDYVASAFQAEGHKGCISCHQDAHPQPGRGDRPQLTHGTILVQNRTSKPVTFELKKGKGDWQEYELKPGHIRRYAVKYARAGQNKSPKYQMKVHAGEPDDARVRTLTPMATPNKDLGSLYFFDKDDKTGLVRLYKPTARIHR